MYHLSAPILREMEFYSQSPSYIYITYKRYCRCFLLAASGFMFRSLIHLGLVFAGWWMQIHYFACRHQVLPTLLVEDAFFSPAYDFLAYLKNIKWLNIYSHVWDFILFHLSTHINFYYCDSEMVMDKHCSCCLRLFWLCQIFSVSIRILG